MKIVAYYTYDTPYEKEVPKFEESLRKFDLDFQVYRTAPRKSWVANCALKPFILKKAIEETKDDILYVDIDARCVRKPPFEELKFCRKPAFPIFGHELLSGTMYFPNNELSRRVLEDWYGSQKSNPGQWDQKVLHRVVKALYPDDYIKLGLHWVKIFDNKRMDLKGEDPVFVHYQASRKNKRIVGK